MSGQRYSKHDLLQETARIGWAELEPHFARGVVIRVDPGLDLVEVATAFANDDHQAVEGWIAAGHIAHLERDTARRWRSDDPELWAVVVAPWVVVQERGRQSA